MKLENVLIQRVTRRKFLTLTAAGAAAATVGCSIFIRNPGGHHSIKSDLNSTDSASPLAWLESSATVPEQMEFSGDRFTTAHGALWSRDAFLASKGGIPAPTESASVVIVGGGIAGLTAAFRLRDQHPVLLEQATRFGGYSQGERWGDLDYSIGAAYLVMPEPGSLPYQLLKELGIYDRARFESEGKESILGSRSLSSRFWSGDSDPRHAQEFVRIRKKLQATFENAYPDVPYKEGGLLTREQIRELDRIPFSKWVHTHLGKLPEHIHEFLHEYCWSSMAGTMDELSAAQTLNFLLADLQGCIAFPGGNAAVAEALYERLKLALPPAHLRNHSFVVNVAAVSDGVNVTYQAGFDGPLKTIHAKACVFTSPKFVARRVVQGIPAQQLEAMAKLRYRAYVVANVFLNHRISSPAYDAFHLTGRIPSDPRSELDQRVYTDFIFGSWAARDQSNRSVLTLYRAYPFAQGRAELIQDQSFSAVRSQFQAIVPELLDGLRIPRKRLAGMRLTRWGHALPLAEAGLIADGTLEKAAAPVENRIFFAQQDNWANPCFETAVSSATQAARLVQAMI